MKITEKDIERFNEKWMPEPNSGCHLWFAYTRKDGKGELSMGRKRRTMLAHVFAYRIHKGEIPPGKQINHKCHLACCVNADHLYAGTQAENIKDMHEAGRAHKAKGAELPFSRYTEKEILEIRALSRAGESYASISRIYGGHRDTIRSICTYKTWKHIP